MGGGAGLAAAPLRRARGDQHAPAQLRGGSAGELHGAGAAAGVPAHLSAERPIADGRAAAAARRARGCMSGILLALAAACWRWYLFRRTCRVPAPRGGRGPACRRVSGRVDAWSGWRPWRPAGLGGARRARRRRRGERRLLRALSEPVAGLRFHRHRRGAAGAPIAPGDRRQASCSARSRPAPAPCSAMPASRRWRCTWSRR